MLVGMPNGTVAIRLSQEVSCRITAQIEIYVPTPDFRIGVSWPCCGNLLGLSLVYDQTSRPHGVLWLQLYEYPDCH